MKTVYLALGSNLGDRQSYLQSAIDKLTSNQVIKLVATSSVMENIAKDMPVGTPDFLNMVIKIQTTLAPLDLLDFVLAVEAVLGRERDTNSNIKNSRTIDIDIILYEDVTLQHERLVLPHPKYQERDFVQTPLQELLAKEH